MNLLFVCGTSVSTSLERISSVVSPNRDLRKYVRATHYDGVLVSADVLNTSATCVETLSAEIKPAFAVVSEAEFRPSMLLLALDGFIEPSTSGPAALTALERARQGQFVAPAWLGSGFRAALRLSYCAFREDMIRMARLTPSETRVLDLLSQHHENKEIASFLGISTPLTQKLILSAYAKLGVRRRTEAAVLWSKLLI